MVYLFVALTILIYFSIILYIFYGIKDQKTLKLLNKIGTCIGLAKRENMN